MCRVLRRVLSILSNGCTILGCRVTYCAPSVTILPPQLAYILSEALREIDLIVELGHENGFRAYLLVEEVSGADEAERVAARDHDLGLSPVYALKSQHMSVFNKQLPLGAPVRLPTNSFEQLLRCCLQRNNAEQVEELEKALMEQFFEEAKCCPELVNTLHYMLLFSNSELSERAMKDLAEILQSSQRGGQGDEACSDFLRLHECIPSDFIQDAVGEAKQISKADEGVLIILPQYRKAATQSSTEEKSAEEKPIHKAVDVAARLAKALRVLRILIASNELIKESAETIESELRNRHHMEACIASIDSEYREDKLGDLIAGYKPRIVYLLPLYDYSKKLLNNIIYTLTRIQEIEHICFILIPETFIALRKKNDQKTPNIAKMFEPMKASNYVKKVVDEEGRLRVPQDTSYHLYIRCLSRDSNALQRIASRK